MNDYPDFLKSQDREKIQHICINYSKTSTAASPQPEKENNQPANADNADSTSLTSSLEDKRYETSSPFVQIGQADRLSLSATSLTGSFLESPDVDGVIRRGSRRDRSNRRRRVVYGSGEEAVGGFSPVGRRRSDPTSRNCDSGFVEDDVLVVPTITKSSPTDDHHTKSSKYFDTILFLH